MTLADPSLVREFEAALAWWRDAGVDCDFSDDATAWLADPAQDERAHHPLRTVQREPKAPEEIIAPRKSLLGESPPDDLAAFRQWWLESPSLAATRLSPRIAPRGERGAPVMVLVPQPEDTDRDHLLSGPQGALLTRILAAMGIAQEAAYIASALPSHMPMADFTALAADGMDEVLAHHIALASPARLIVFGMGLAPLLGVQPGEALRDIIHNGVNVPVIMSETLDALMDMPRLKARFWKKWIEWSVSH